MPPALLVTNRPTTRKCVVCPEKLSHKKRKKKKEFMRTKLRAHFCSWQGEFHFNIKVNQPTKICPLHFHIIKKKNKRRQKTKVKPTSSKSHEAGRGWGGRGCYLLEGAPGVCSGCLCWLWMDGSSLTLLNSEFKANSRESHLAAKHEPFSATESHNLCDAGASSQPSVRT